MTEVKQTECERLYVCQGDNPVVEYRIGRGQSAGIASIMQPTTGPKVGFGSNCDLAGWATPRIQISAGSLKAD
jgi:hypothetical protein